MRYLSLLSWCTAICRYITRHSKISHLRDQTFSYFYIPTCQVAMMEFLTTHEGNLALITKYCAVTSFLVVYTYKIVITVFYHFNSIFVSSILIDSSKPYFFAFYCYSCFSSSYASFFSFFLSHLALLCFNIFRFQCSLWTFSFRLPLPRSVCLLFLSFELFHHFSILSSIYLHPQLSVSRLVMLIRKSYKNSLRKWNTAYS